MEIDYKGANCVVIKDKNALIIVDPTDNASVSDLKNPEAVILATQPKFAPGDEDDSPSFIIDMPGEYEHKDVSVLEALGTINVVIIPVGGNGYTLDADDAGTIIRQLNPNIVIPTHFDDGQTKYEVPQDNLEAFEKEMGHANIEK